uniref:Uncharacterized protein n=1 Tax=Anopheles merus TaxID=30066 RepID=A0A182UMT9_ANOME
MTLWREVSAALEGKAKCRPRTPSVRVNCTNIPPGTFSEEISSEMSAALGFEIFSDQITTVKTHYGFGNWNAGGNATGATNTGILQPASVARPVIANVTVAQKISTRGRHPVYWWTSEIDRLRSHFHGMKRRFNRARTEEQREERRQLKSDARAALERAIKLSKDQQKQDLPEQLEPHGFGPAYQIRM